jgi:hypothetical protein
MTTTLVAGTEYRLTKDIAIGRCEFLKGEVINFTSGGYSPYDDCYVYHFVKSTGEKCICATQSVLTESELECFE